MESFLLYADYPAGQSLNTSAIFYPAVASERGCIGDRCLVREATVTVPLRVSRSHTACSGTIQCAWDVCPSGKGQV